ncbi:hypothetical protein EBB_03520 [Methylomonas sp. EbB]|uniref:Uncharacterized protein n=1 Tax=Methylomonas fluvii TaxID=1854564 RepID=A0ABR9D941_9GAMM|nr:hypothetical protein [Methylomonas fluvii]
MLTINRCSRWLKYTPFPTADFCINPVLFGYAFRRFFAVLESFAGANAGRKPPGSTDGFEFIPVFVREQLS